jgi:hypothetical protein
MSESNNEQMDLGSGAASNSNAIDTTVPMTSSPSDVTTSEQHTTSQQLKLTIKTPKDKKDISIDGSSTVKQVRERVRHVTRFVCQRVHFFS